LSPPCAGHRLLTVLLGCWLGASLRAHDYWIAPPDCTSCSTSYTNNSSSNPLRFVTTNVQQIINLNPLATFGDPEVVLRFLPGEYLTGPFT